MRKAFVTVLCLLPLFAMAWRNTSTRSSGRSSYCGGCGGKLYYGRCPKCNPDAGRIPMRKKATSAIKRSSTIFSEKNQPREAGTNKVDAASQISVSDIDREIALMKLKNLNGAEKFKNHRCPYRTECEHCKKLFDEKRLTKTYCESCFVCKAKREKEAQDERELQELMNAAKKSSVR